MNPKWGLMMAAMLLSSCEPRPPGQVILAIQTDMSLPKDIDFIRIDVSYDDTKEFIGSYPILSNSDGVTDFRLPATLNIFSRDDKPARIRVHVVGFRGQPKEIIRVKRDLVFEIQPNRVLTLPVPLEFLCDGVEDCDPGQTCQAGACRDETIQVAEFEEYRPAEIFGEPDAGVGACFDTRDCFATIAHDAQPQFSNDETICYVDLPDALTNESQLSVALETQGSGSCNAEGCYVALDKDSPNGWRSDASGKRVQLPPAVCIKSKRGEIAKVVFSTKCLPKLRSRPTCGPWSSAGQGIVPDPNEPTLVVGGQVNPYSMILDGDAIYWTTQGTLRTSDAETPDFVGAVKAVPKQGGSPIVVAKSKLDNELNRMPQELAMVAFDATDARRFLVWTEPTNTAAGRIGWAKVQGVDELRGDLLSGLPQPTGIVSKGANIYFTEQASGHVWNVRTAEVGNTLTSNQQNEVPRIVSGIEPFSIAVASKQELVCFAYQGSGAADGIVACNNNSGSYVVAENQRLPRSLVMYEGTETWLYWAEFVENGTIRRADPTKETPQPSETVIPSVSFPAGIAVDETQSGPILYYTSWSAGTVHAFDVEKSAEKFVIDGRKNPLAVTTDKEFVYWVEGGTPNQKDGKILKRRKEPKPTP